MPYLPQSYKFSFAFILVVKYNDLEHINIHYVIFMLCVVCVFPMKKERLLYYLTFSSSFGLFTEALITGA